MRLYQWDIQLLSGSLTPWHSDTIFGHICWAIAEREGTDTLHDIIDKCLKGTPPFVFSDGFPAGFLPMPCSNLMSPSTETLCKADALAVIKQAKKIKKMQYLSLDAFQDMIMGRSVFFEKLNTKEIITYSTVHNTIDRNIGATLKGGLFSEIETWTDAITVYALIEDGWEKKTENLIERIESKGYGAKVSRGKGYFKTIYFGPSQGIDIPSNPNGFIILSHCLPTKDMPTASQYQIRIKYGKLGANIENDNPFKRPAIMLEPGSVFWTSKAIKPWCGRIVQNIHSHYPNVIQNGMAITVPCNIQPPKSLEEHYAECF